jgi:hypothetical protein
MARGALRLDENMMRRDRIAALIAMATFAEASAKDSSARD